MREVRVHPYVEDGELKVTVSNVDRETRVHQILNPDGTWSKVSLYTRESVGAFAVSKSRTEEIAKELTVGGAV